MSRLIQLFIVWYMKRQWDRKHTPYIEHRGFIIRIFTTDWFLNQENTQTNREKELENERRFINGEIAIHVTNERQSQFLIDLTKKSCYPKKNAIKIPMDAYKKYPYYFILNWRHRWLNAYKEIYHKNVPVLEFEEVFHT